MIKPFASAEQALQWYFDCQEMKTTSGDSRFIREERPCTLVEIPVVASKLLRDKKITPGQFLIFRKLADGLITWVPDALLPKWQDFVAKMEQALMQKKIVDKERYYV